jgi:hypothetical protein
MSSETCKAMNEILDSHLPGCPRCQEAHRAVQGVLAAPNELRLPCAEGLSLINDHIASCLICRRSVDAWASNTARLIKSPTGPGN